MKKIIISLSVIAAVVAVAVGVTAAYFSDTETSTGNTFSAGSLNLEVGTVDPLVEHMTFSGLKPTDSGNGKTWLVQNTGSVTGKFGVQTSVIANTEGTNYESETNITGDGDLGANLTLAMWVDVDKSNGWSSGDYYLKSDQTKIVWASGTSLPTAAYEVVDNFSGKTWTNLQDIAGTTEAGNFRVEYNWPSGTTDNDAMGDITTFDIIFSLQQ